MKKTVFKAIIPLMLIIFYSCNTSKNLATKYKNVNFIPLTNSLIKEYNLTIYMLRNFQYYTGSEPITLEIEKTEKGASIDKEGKILIKNNEYLEKIILPPYTPGVCTNIIKKDSSYIIRIVFGINNGSYLVFGPGNQDSDGTFILYALKGSTALDCKIRYGKKIYDVTSGIGSNIYLNSKNIKGYNHSKIEPGRKIGH